MVRREQLHGTLSSGSWNVDYAMPRVSVHHTITIKPRRATFPSRGNHWPPCCLCCSCAKDWHLNGQWNGAYYPGSNAWVSGELPISDAPSEPSCSANASQLLASTVIDKRRAKQNNSLTVPLFRLGIPCHLHQRQSCRSKTTATDVA